MKNIVKVLVVGSMLLSQAAAQESIEQNQTAEEQNITISEQVNQEVIKPVIGAVEQVRIIPGNILLDARIDTGAKTSSLGVDEMEVLHEDGEEWVQVSINGHTSKHKVVKFIKIKQHRKASIRRPVIRLRMILGDVSESVDVTLADRSNFKYKMLIGRNFLYERFIVDVSLKYTQMPELYEEK
ncbi:MAG: RimK/LysX family protein [Sulfurimonas sp.]